MTHFNPSNDTPNPNELTEYLANSQRIFRLIDGILPLELCLHHEILPLELNSDRLTLGMVNYEDENALNLIRPIITSLGYTLDLKSIDAQTHQAILASYLKNPGSTVRDRHNRDSAPTIIGRPEEMPAVNRDRRHFDAPTVIGRPEEMPAVNRDRRHFDAPTVIGRPEEMPAVNRDRRHFDAPTIIGRPEEMPAVNRDRRHFDAPTVIGRPEEMVKEPMTENSVSEIEIPSDFDIGNITIDSANSQQPTPDNEPIGQLSELIANSTPRQTWQKLYQKILNGEIDRLCLKNHNNFCQIIGSHNEAAAFSWQDVEPSVFTAIANEVKALVKLPPVPLEKPRRVAMEKRRNNERLLLRIELTPSIKGEEIVFAALKGKTLQTYDRQQLEKMSEQALTLAQKLEKTVKSIALSAERVESQNIVTLKSTLTAIYKRLEAMDK
ncbi:hypothetical protein [Myxosarcina sp. GI1]|uniref:hypothetical protein n=1 Tax=Myxosarcina sp. GI1 TaxID=1541065 RepID=UPI00056C47B0|nr:hypothetical protein [Myxosarcina sp. GI1]